MRGVSRWYRRTSRPSRKTTRRNRSNCIGLAAWLTRVFHYHGPTGIMARTWTTGATVAAVTLVFGVVLLLSYV